VGADRNSIYLYSVRSTYVCPYSFIGYNISWKYRLVEDEHAEWKKVVDNDDNTALACNFTLSAYDLRASRLIAATPDEPIDLRYARDFLEKTNVTVRIVRGDRLSEPANNFTLNP
ncbi:hypothetical protein PMAYCL1PPCAC_31733, partial [Pristionchus mayeri]